LIMGTRRLIIEFLALCRPLEPTLILKQISELECLLIPNGWRAIHTGSTTSTLILDESM
jgi:hypothetical protein